ncbi:MAG: hypothetical protein ACN4GW_12180 [Desulforhopalus sp.]
MLDNNWLYLLFLSFLLVALVNGLLASCTTLYYNKKSTGHLSHSQLRIKQGNATFEHRLNVFGQYLVFSIFTLSVYLISLLVWFIINLVLYFWPFF